MKNNKMTGVLLIVFGLIYLALQVLGQLGIVRFYIWDFWPLIIMMIGVFFESLYLFNRQRYGFLFPGGFFTTLGILFLFETVTNWDYVAYTWPIYLFAIFIGFFQMYWATKRTWTLVLSMIFFLLVLFCYTIVIGVFMGAVGFELIVAVMIIAVGLSLLISSFREKRS